MSHSDPPRCTCCPVPLSVVHLLINCPRYASLRQSLFPTLVSHHFSRRLSLSFSTHIAIYVIVETLIKSSTQSSSPTVPLFRGKYKVHFILKENFNFKDPLNNIMISLYFFFRVENNSIQSSRVPDFPLQLASFTPSVLLSLLSQLSSVSP